MSREPSTIRSLEAYLVENNRHSETTYLNELFDLIAFKLAQVRPWLNTEILFHMRD